LGCHPVRWETQKWDTYKSVHFIGLLSDGGVHAHTSHLRALCDIAEKKGVKNSYVHAFLDGRDVDPKSGSGYLKTLEEERIKLAYDLLVNGTGTATQDPVAAVNESYQKDVTDEFIQPLVCVDNDNQPVGKIQPDDVVSIS